MLDFFFYGTLRDPEIRRLVLGREVPPEDVYPATLPGHRRYAVRGAPYPAAIRQAGAEIDGVVLRGLDAGDAGRLSSFEGDDYTASLVSIEVARNNPGNDQPARAWVFLASDRVPLTKTGWSLDAWQATQKGRFLTIAHGWLDAIGEDKLAAQERLWHTRLDRSRAL